MSEPPSSEISECRGTDVDGALHPGYGDDAGSPCTASVDLTVMCMLLVAYPDQSNATTSPANILRECCPPMLAPIPKVGEAARKSRRVRGSLLSEDRFSTAAMSGPMMRAA